VSISDGGSSNPPNWCFFGWLLALTQLLLHGALGLVLFWVIYYLGGFGWHDQPKLEFNYHPVLMIGGFVYLSGNGKLLDTKIRLCKGVKTTQWNSNFEFLKKKNDELCLENKVHFKYLSRNMNFETGGNKIMERIVKK
jgi:hypothetical protein